MSMVIPPNHRQGELGVISPLELDKVQCGDIIELHKDPQNVHKTARINAENSNVVDLKTRDTDVWVIHEDHHWVDALICTAALTANQTFELNISGLMERPQLLRYKAPSNGYDWHMDIGRGDASTRKISISILLNDDYEGGELGFFITGDQSIKPDTGQAIAFPSFLPHRVTPLTKGIRWSLVCWITGEPFR
jgi:PKHD-type hydroxylase